MAITRESWVQGLLGPSAPCHTTQQQHKMFEGESRSSFNFSVVFYRMDSARSASWFLWCTASPVLLFWYVTFRKQKERRWWRLWRISMNWIIGTQRQLRKLTYNLQLNFKSLFNVLCFFGFLSHCGAVSIRFYKFQRTNRDRQSFKLKASVLCRLNFSNVLSLINFILFCFHVSTISETLVFHFLLLKKKKIVQQRSWELF